jgi:hypothetical protein
VGINFAKQTMKTVAIYAYFEPIGCLSFNVLVMHLLFPSASCCDEDKKDSLAMEEKAVSSK